MEQLADNQAFHRISMPGFPDLGYLAIDTTYNGSSMGGVRILPDVSAAEISHMARTMTRKYLFSGIPNGGAKAGIVLQGNAARDRAGALHAFGRALAPHMNGGFWPGCDMGASNDDIRLILRGAGRPTLQSSPMPSDRYTAWSVVNSIDAVLSREGRSFEGCRIAIEGFGRVGGLVASLASGRGALITAISNVCGCVTDSRGIDVHSMLELRRGHGDAFINRCPGLEPAPKEAVFHSCCDVFVPAARCWTLDAHAARLRARSVVCAANVPMTRETERRLWKRGVQIVPDAAANCGGVVGLVLSRFMDDSAIWRIFETRFQGRINDILASGLPPSDYLDAFIERRKRDLARELAPRRRTRLDYIRGAIEYHLTEPLLGRRRLESGLFPLQ